MNKYSQSFPSGCSFAFKIFRRPIPTPIRAQGNLICRSAFNSYEFVPFRWTVTVGDLHCLDIRRGVLDPGHDCVCVCMWVCGCFKVGDNRLRHNKTTGPGDAVLGNFLHGKLESKQSLLFWLNFSHSTRLCVAVNDDKAGLRGLWFRFKVNSKVFVVFFCLENIIIFISAYKTHCPLIFWAQLSFGLKDFYGPLHSNIGLSHLKSDWNSSSPQTQRFIAFYKPNTKI